MENIEDYKSNYDKKGTILIQKNCSINPLDENDINLLNLYCEKVEKEYVSIGDAGESNNLLVGRFMTDVDKPLIVDNPYSNDVVKVLSQEKVKTFIKKILNIDDKIFLRRIQFNQIDKNCFVGYHLDTDSNPDYLAACVIQLGDDFEGGVYRVYQKDKSYNDFFPTKGSLIVSNCTYPHEVTKVTKGHRKSLVFFISKHFGKNKRYS